MPRAKSIERKVKCQNCGVWYTLHRTQKFGNYSACSEPCYRRLLDPESEVVKGTNCRWPDCGCEHAVKFGKCPYLKADSVIDTN